MHGQAQTRRLAKTVPMVWCISGLVGAILIATLAYRRSRGTGGFYDADVYLMSARTHRSWALASLAFAAVFLVTWFASAYAIGFWAFAAFTLFAIFYLTSYLRGAYEDDE